MDVTSPSYAEGRILDFEGEEHIATDLLQTFPYEGPRQKILYETREFSAVCPYSGLPDYACLSVEYIPAATIVELKSLKYYLTSFRNVGILQEHAVNRLLRDLVAILDPRAMLIEAHYNERGGLRTMASVKYERQLS